jgi:hypothetical protein
MMLRLSSTLTGPQGRIAVNGLPSSTPMRRQLPPTPVRPVDAAHNHVDVRAVNAHIPEHSVVELLQLAGCAALPAPCSKAPASLGDRGKHGVLSFSSTGRSVHRPTATVAPACFSPIFIRREFRFICF